MSELRRDLALALDPAQLLRAVGLEPDPWQEELLRARPRRAILLCCRQAGKTMTASVSALHEALYRPGSLILIVAPSQRQSAELLRTVRAFFSLLAIPVAATSESSGGLELANGSRIVSLPAKEETVRGYSEVALLIVDEAARVDDGLYYALRPMLAVSDGRLLLLSTPNGQRGFYFEAWRGPDPWHRVRITATECARISTEFLAEERRNMLPAVYASEYECEFGDAIDSVFAADDIEAALEPTVTPIFEGGW